MGEESFFCFLFFYRGYCICVVNNDFEIKGYEIKVKF